MKMLEQLQVAYDQIESLGQHIGEMEKRARWGMKLKGSAVEFALELVAVRDLGRETEKSLSMLQADIRAMLETLNRTQKMKEKA